MKKYVETEELKQQLRTEAALGYVKTLEDVEKIIDFCGASAQPPADQWIPCSERLPKGGELCLVTRRIGFEYVRQLAMHNTKEWRIAGAKVDWGEIVAWMPLPEPYKGE